MIAYLFLLIALLGRVLPHAGLWNFSAVGGALLYFGARRPLREMIAPLAVLITADYYLTTFSYHSAFRWQSYVTTWIWYAAIIVLGSILLKSRTTWLRGAVAALLGPTSFFIVVDYAVWAASGMYPHNWSGLLACYVAAIPFYRNDVISTALVLGVAFGVPVLVRKLHTGTSIEAAAQRS